MPAPPEFFRVTNRGPQTTRLDIFDSIGDFVDWLTGKQIGQSAAAFSVALRSIDTEEIELHLNSPGGSVVDGLQIFNELRRHPAKVTVIVDGQAASIASIVAMAGDDIVMPANATFWIHDPAGWVDLSGYQQADELRRAAGKALSLADDLDTTRNLLANIYVERSGGRLDHETVLAMMTAETTITAADAVKWGLADRIEEPLKIAAHFDMAALRDQTRAAVAACLGAHCQPPAPPVNALPPAPPVDRQPPAPRTDALREIMNSAPEDAIAQLNARLDAVGADWRAAAVDPPGDPRKVMATCSLLGFPQLAVDAVNEGLGYAALRARLAMARDLQNRIAGAGPPFRNLFEPLFAALLKDPVHAIILAMSYKMENDDAVIASDHDGGYRAGFHLDPLAIQKQRQSALGESK